MNMTQENTDRIETKMREYFLRNGWPPTTIFTGEDSYAKEQFIFESIALSLFAARNDQNKTLEEIRANIFAKEHPDFVYFAAEKVQIGKADSAKEGSVRFLLQNVLSRYPVRGNQRFVFFADASLLQNEAESALLKSLEEPRKENHFFLAVDNAESLKETIRSRSVEIPVKNIVELEKTPSDPWERFWFFSGWQDSALYNLLQEKEFLPEIISFYEELNRSKKDAVLFDSFFSKKFKPAFAKETMDKQSLLLKLTFLPFYFSCRDLLLEGDVPTWSPIRFEKSNIENLLEIIELTRLFFYRLSYRYFGTIASNVDLVFYNFINKLMPLWVLKK